MLSWIKEHVLFKGLSDAELQTLLLFIKEVQLKPGEILIKENDIDNHIYILKEGMVAVSKWDEDAQQSHHLAFLEAGEVIGEVSMLDNMPRSASVHAHKTTQLYVISVDQLRNSYSVKDSHLFHHLVQNLTTILGKRIRVANESLVKSLSKELETTKMQLTMGLMLIVIIMNFVIYITALFMLEKLPISFLPNGVVNIIMISIFSVLVLGLIKKSGYSLSFYGITLNNWPSAIKESLLCTVFLMILAVGLKWALIHSTLSYADNKVFDLPITHLMNRSIWLDFFGLLIYLLFVPFQELIVRGSLQSLLHAFLINRYKTFWAVLLPNLIFAISHLHLSPKFGLLVFFPGLLWGILFARTRSLLGVSLSHQIIGIFGLGVVGF